MQDATVVLPTYNEAENLTDVVERVLGAECRVLVVDDASPDGTGAIADALAQRYSDVSVLHRGTKDGLGPAYAAGFAAALDGGSGLIGQMDADLSHDPGDLMVLVDAMVGGADVAIGSRYVPGGSSEGWPWPRRALSRGGNWYARTLLGIDVRDVTSGMRMWTPGALRRVEPASCDASGYGFQVEMAMRAQDAGLKIVEVPIAFRDRQRGQSKMTASIAVEAMVRVTGWSIRRPRRTGT